MFSRWCFHPSNESSSLIMLISVKSQLYPPVKHFKVGHVPWKLGIHDPCLDMVHCHVWFPISSHVTLNMSLAKPGTGAKFHHVCNPPLGQRQSPSTSPYWGWNLHWISGDVKQNPIKIPSKSHQNLRRLKMCISHPQNGTFTNLWTMAVSEVIGNMLGNNYWLGTSLVILCNQQVVRWICLKNGEIIPLKHPYTYHRENVQTKPCLLSQGWQRWHMLTSLKSLKQTHPTEPLQLTHCKQSRRQSQSPSIKNE